LCEANSGPWKSRLDRLIRSGFATIQRETLEAGDRTIEIGRITITDAGRRALEG
jgi:hypothetical protein